MGAMFSSLWQKIKIHPVRTVLMVLLAVVIVLIILSSLGYIFNWDWTGLNATDFTSTPQKITRTIAYQPEKTLWDWLQLLIIPAVLAVAGYVINLTISSGEQAATEQRAKSEREAAEKSAETEREIAQDNQRETALKEYIDKMAELFLHEDLLGSDPKPEVRKIAQIQTLTVLNRLDGKRKGSVIKFLYESRLIIEGDKRILSLSGADLHGVDLRGADLFRADLHGTNLKEALLVETNLWRANLGEADLRFANLSKASLEETNLTMTNLSHAILVEAYLGKAILDLTELVGANLEKAYLEDAIIVNYPNFSEANLREATIWQQYLVEGELDLKGATMPDGTIHP